VFQQTTTESFTQHLSIENKQAYDENVDLIQELKDDLATKQKRHQDDPRKCYHFILEIMSSIEQLETKNKDLLVSKVSSIFMMHSKLQNYN
jgi:hypothetical protein